MQRRLSVLQIACEKYKTQMDAYAGPALVEIFGEQPFEPIQKDEAFALDEKQQELRIQLMTQESLLYKKYIDFPYKIINDSNSGGYAELWHAKKIKNMIYLSLSNSIGGAVLMNNEIYYGDRMHSGEFGHMTFEIKGRQCYCGKKGCVDAYCNAQNLSNLTDGDLGKFIELVVAGEER